MPSKESLHVVVNAKKVGKALKMLARIRRGMPAASKELRDSCELWVRRLI